MIEIRVGVGSGHRPIDVAASMAKLEQLVADAVESNPLAVAAVLTCTLSLASAGVTGGGQGELPALCPLWRRGEWVVYRDEVGRDR